ncbi:TetR family transcriptional regulator [Magnetospirillum fulvum MGU-K5]|uniref:TetR family transcriptional regulator n=1 Tax=Magnetospirillum fulvum MGU-K5 TaxID=1316936 RepID=S9TEN9_MAGFU|nr:TetR family transcriptional regulator [Magnetospirillum fulvum MGU-K5]
MIGIESVPYRSGRQGRPCAGGSEALDRHILATATRLFIEHGYSATSVEHIAEQAGTGKNSIYRRHTTKEKLFEAVVTNLCTPLVEAASRFEKDLSNPLAALKESCRTLLTFVLMPESVAVYRLMTAEARRFPDLVERVQRKATEPYVASIRRLLETARQNRQIRPDCDVENTERAIMGLITGWAVDQAMLGLEGLRAEKERETFFENAWRIFISGVSPA